MIFHYDKSCETPFDADYEQSSDLFKFAGVKDLIYKNNKPTNVMLQTEDKYFFSDIIASMYKKLYEHGLTNHDTTISALLSCSFHLQCSGYKFLGFIKKDDEIDSSDDDEIACFKEWDFKTDSVKSNSEVSISDFFRGYKFDTETNNVFFVAGTQFFETLALRIKRASLLIALLYNDNLITNHNTKIILSGRNNAFSRDSKVNYSNESITMSNLISYRLKHYTDSKIADDFLKENIYLEMNSRNSIENINEMYKLINTFKSNRTQTNLFIVSSSPHLLQLNEALKTTGIIEDEKVNLFLVGSENPSHKFEIYNSSYIKYLMNEIIFRNTKINLF